MEITLQRKQQIALAILATMVILPVPVRYADMMPQTLYAAAGHQPLQAREDFQTLQKQLHGEITL